MRLVTRRELLLGVALSLSACAEQKPTRTPVSSEHVEFFSNGGVLNLDSRLNIIVHPDRLNALVTETNGGLKLPEDYVIVTMISPLLPSQATPDKLLASIPPNLEGKIQSQFLKQLIDRKYSVSYLLSQDAVENVVRTIPREPNKSYFSRDLDMKEIYSRLSGQLSIGWFFTVREQYAAETGLPKPSRQIPGKIGEIIAKTPPIEVISMTEGARFNN